MEYLLVSSYTEKLGHVQSVMCPHSNSISIFKREKDSEDISSFGKLVLLNQVDAGPNATYMCSNKERNRLYVVNEVFTGAILNP